LRAKITTADSSITAETGSQFHAQGAYVERAGATIAEVPVFDSGTFPSSAAAEEDSVVLFIDKRDVRRLCLKHPQIAIAALEVLAGRLRRAVGLIEALSLREVDQRLARLLLSEARLSGQRTGRGMVFDLMLWPLITYGLFMASLRKRC
jgi:CRP-like cAMP-binding protein